MSVQAITWAYRQQPLSPSDKFVLVTLANYSDDRGFCWPKQETLAGDTGYSERTVRDHLRALEQQGFITREKRYLKNGNRTSDGMYLQLAKKGAGEDRSDNRQDLPVVVCSTGKNTPDYRQDLPVVDQGTEPSANCQKSTNLTKGLPADPAGKPSLEPSREPSLARARAAPSDDGASARAALEEPDADTPINAHWRAKQDDLARYFGADYRHWLRGLIPHSADGETLVLAAEGRFVRDVVERDYVRGLEKVLGRKVRIVVTKYAAARAERRRQKLSAAP